MNVVKFISVQGKLSGLPGHMQKLKVLRSTSRPCAPASKKNHSAIDAEQEL
jgi:hypothetical protein